MNQGTKLLRVYNWWVGFAIIHKLLLLKETQKSIDRMEIDHLSLSFSIYTPKEVSLKHSLHSLLSKTSFRSIGVREIGVREYEREREER